jgi:hypothetical protein
MNKEDVLTAIAWIIAAGFNIWVLNAWLRRWQRRRNSRKADRVYERAAARRWGRDRR